MKIGTSSHQPKCRLELVLTSRSNYLTLGGATCVGCP